MADDKKTKKASAKKPERNTRGQRQGTEAILYLVVVLVVLVAANVVAHLKLGGARIDLTETRRYSLSDASKRLVGDLRDDMEITAYFTSDLPPPFNTHEQYVRNLLQEYEAASGGHIDVRFVNPDDEDEREEAEEAGVPEVEHRAIENDSFSVKQGYRGLVIRYLGDKQTIPVIQDVSGLEYAITQAIRQLVSEPLPIGLISGHGGPSLTKGLSYLSEALPLYDVREVTLDDEIDPELRAIITIDPIEEFSEDELRRIDQFVMRGRSLGVFGGAYNVTLEGAPAAAAANTGINRLLQGWGMELGDGIVASAECLPLPMQRLPIPVPYPPFPIAGIDEEAQEHPALFRLRQVPFAWAAPIELSDRFDELNGIRLAQSSDETSWVMAGESIQLRQRRPDEWRFEGERGPHTLLAAVEGTLPSAFADAAGEEASSIEAPAESTAEARVLVAGSGWVLHEELIGYLQQIGQQAPAAAAAGPFALNSIDWLAQDADLIAIRAKNIEDPALDVPQNVRLAQEDIQAAAEEEDQGQFDEARDRHSEAMDAWAQKKWTYRLSIILGMPLLVALFGLIRWQMRKNKRASLQELRKKLAAKKA